MFILTIILSGGIGKGIQKYNLFFQPPFVTLLIFAGFLLMRCFYITKEKNEKFGMNSVNLVPHLKENRH